MEKTNIIRNKDTLNGIRDIAKLQQWLYANENNSVTVLNSIGTRFKLTMDAEGYVWCENLDTPVPTKPFAYDSMLDLPIWFGIIDQLSAQPPVNPATDTASRWEEIQLEAAMMLALND